MVVVAIVSNNIDTYTRVSLSRFSLSLTHTKTHSHTHKYNTRGTYTRTHTLTTQRPSIAPLDFQTNLQLFNTLPPTTRNRLTVFLFFVFGCTLLIVALGAGLPLVGRIYRPYLDPLDSENGRLTNVEQLIGIVLLLYVGTGGIMLLSNLIPSLVVLNLPIRVVRLLLALISTSSAVGLALCMFYLIEPQKTYTDTMAIGSNDPILATIGAFYLFAFAFLMILSGCVLVYMTPQLATIRRLVRKKVKKVKHRVIFIIALFVFLA